MKYCSFIIFSFLSIYSLQQNCASVSFFSNFLHHSIRTIASFLKIKSLLYFFLFSDVGFVSTYFRQRFRKRNVLEFFLIPHFHQSQFIFSLTLTNFLKMNFCLSIKDLGLAQNVHFSNFHYFGLNLCVSRKYYFGWHNSLFKERQ